MEKRVFRCKHNYTQLLYMKICKLKFGDIPTYSILAYFWYIFKIIYNKFNKMHTIYIN